MKKRLRYCNSPATYQTFIRLIMFSVGRNYFRQVVINTMSVSLLFCLNQRSQNCAVVLRICNISLTSEGK